LPLAVLRRNIGYVPQDTFLFSVPLRENVAFGVDEATPVGVARAVETARLSKDVDQFPQGLDTMIGERGVTLSGGQKQRTALARAIMRDPAILILDDALSSIDTQTQAEILAGLRQVLANRTSIIISQRISTVKAADEIVVLDDGRIIEQGTHQTLLTRSGMYARMYRRELLSQELDEG
jgi:ATP-binding cassette subfamily B protein